MEQEAKKTRPVFFRLRQCDYDEMARHAKRARLCVAHYIRQAVFDKMDKDNKREGSRYE